MQTLNYILLALTVLALGLTLFGVAKSERAVTIVVLVDLIVWGAKSAGLI